MYTEHVAGCLHNPVGQLPGGYLSGEGPRSTRLGLVQRDLAVCHRRAVAFDRSELPKSPLIELRAGS
jgi:hypothetical protein